jgi:hypothetical protein
MAKAARATPDELNQAHIDIEYLIQVFGTRAEAARQIGVGHNLMRRISNGEEGILRSSTERIRSATARIENASSAGSTEQPKKAGGGVIVHARAANRNLKDAVEELLSAAEQAPAISALGFEHLAHRVEELRVKYLVPII